MNPPAETAEKHRRLALGAYLPAYQLDPEAKLAGYAELAGRPPAIVHWFQRWSPDGEFDPRPAEVAQRIGAVPMISWEPWQGLEPIATGALDDYIRRYASSAAAMDGPLLLRFAHEMNLREIPWYGAPDLYRSAWTRVHAILREINSRNVSLVWSPYVIDDNADEFSPYFPGPEQVEWVALDGYNWGRRHWWNRWASFDTVFGASYRSLAELAPGKPMMLAEIGCSERGGDKAAWMDDALLHAIPDRYPLMDAVVWFNQDRPDHADWRVDSSPPARDVWRRVAADPRYSLSGSELRRG
jgi:hypothetical protein